MRQMASASLNVYKSGTDTRNARREIILDYLNTVPLAAVPVYGEINGLGEGLQAWFGESLDKVCTNLQSQGSRPEKVQAVKQVLSLLSAVPAPSYYLIQNRTALQTRVLYYVRAMEKSGLIDANLLTNWRSRHASSRSRPLFPSLTSPLAVRPLMPFAPIL